MVKVLRILNRFNLGGPTFNAGYLAKYLAPEFETLLVAGMKDESEESSMHIIDELRVKPIMIPEMKREVSIVNDRVAYRKIKKIISDFKPDIVHTHAAKAGAIGRLAAINSNVRIIIHTFHGHVFHSYFNKVKTKIFLEIERYLASRSTRLIALSNHLKDELINEYKICNPDKIEVIPLGFELNRFFQDQTEKRNDFREKNNINHDDIAIGIIGRLVPIKNHELFIRSIAKINSKSDRKIKAFIIGDGEERNKLENLAIKLNIDFANEQVPNKSALLVFTSWIKEIDYAIAGMDIIALTSLNEGTPVSLIEAQAAGKPIVSTNVGGVSDVVFPERSALLSESMNLEEFSDNLLRLIENEDLRVELAQYGRDQIIEKYDYTVLIKNLTKLYNKLLCE